MHGNEPSGRQLTLAAALAMCENPHDAAVRETLGRMHLVFVPTLNPDGFELKQRGDRCAAAAEQLLRSLRRAAAAWGCAPLEPCVHLLN